MIRVSILAVIIAFIFANATCADIVITNTTKDKDAKTPVGISIASGDETMIIPLMTGETKTYPDGTVLAVSAPKSTTASIMTTRGTFYLDAYDKASVNAFGYVKCDTGFINGADLQGNPIILSQGESQASQELSNTLDKLDQETQAQDIVQAGR